MIKHILTLCAAGWLLSGTYASADFEYTVDQWEIELLAQVTMAEAEGESELGKRLVIDTILNRVELDEFPDTIESVIYEPDQFSCMWDGRFYEVGPDADVQALVWEELEDRTNEDVVYFRTGWYEFGTPLFQEGNHYFSALN